MIIEYHRPHTLEQALELLAREEPLTLPLGGGSLLNRPSPRPFAVVDLQALKLEGIRRRGGALEIGAVTRLQTLYAAFAGSEGEARSPVLAQVILYEAGNNVRNVATLAGALVAADGRSHLATALLALDARLTLRPGIRLTVEPDGEGQAPAEHRGAAVEISLGDLLPLRASRLRGQLITHISLPLNARLAYEYVARTPADRPIVCVAAAQWPSGRTRVALGGFGSAPALAMDGPQAEGAEIAARNAASQAEDAWASAEYRQEIAEILTRRCMQTLRELKQE